VAGGLTVLPLLGGAGLAWSVDLARADFPSLLGFLLLGAGVALADWLLDGLGRLLLSPARRAHAGHRIGLRLLQTAWWGTVAGLAGGLAFTLAMLKVGFLAEVARVVGSTSLAVGFALHLGCSVGVGISYGLLFRNQGDDAGAALGHGLCYGFFWWVLGSLTMLPVLLGGQVLWTVAGAASAFASLVGHLTYGAGLGLTFHLLKHRGSARRPPPPHLGVTAVPGRQQQLVASAPALSVLMVVIVLTVPIILSGQGQ
jgi:hypothetical protein